MSIKVFTKDQNEFDYEQNQRDVAARMVKGTPIKVCPYFVKTAQGDKIDVWDLSEHQILGFCTQSITEGQLQEGHMLLGILGSRYKPSLEGMKTIIQLLENDNRAVRAWAADMLTPVAEEKLQQINAVTSFVQRSQGNFEKPSKEQKLEVIDQMIEQEQAMQNVAPTM